MSKPKPLLLGKGKEVSKNKPHLNVLKVPSVKIEVKISQK